MIELKDTIYYVLVDDYGNVKYISQYPEWVEKQLRQKRWGVIKKVRLVEVI